MGSQRVFFQIVRLGIGHCAGRITGKIDWNYIYDLAISQGLSAIIVDGVERLPEKARPPKSILLQWIGEVLQSYECRYELYKRAIAEMACFYNSHGYKMMVLKGYVCSLDWPRPEHRPCGDIDIWQFGQQKKADLSIIQEKGIKIDDSHHHHTVFYWRDFMVENHYDFINVHHNKSNPDLELIFKDLGQDASHWVELNNEKVYVPCPNLHALFLIRHAVNHFASSEITIRHLMDWAFFVEKHGNEVDWKWMEVVMGRFGMKQMCGIFNAICVEELGFDTRLFPEIQFNPLSKDRVLDEILTPQFTDELPANFFKRVLYKLRRWKANRWKRELCYNESGFYSFWFGVKSHLIKPSTI